MKLFAATLASLVLVIASSVRAEGKMPEDMRAVAPALEKYAQGPLADLWKRPGLAPRDRSIVTLAALVARNQTTHIAYHLNLPLDNRVQPRKLPHRTPHPP